MIDWGSGEEGWYLLSCVSAPGDDGYAANLENCIDTSVSVRALQKFTETHISCRRRRSYEVESQCMKRDIVVLEDDVCALTLADVDSLICRTTLEHKSASSRAFVYSANVPIRCLHMERSCSASSTSQSH